MSILIRTKKYFKKGLSDERRARLRDFQAHRFRGLQHHVSRVLIGSNLNLLADLNDSDKWGTHWYTPHYNDHFLPLRKKRLNILEIGIGGYEDPRGGGGSLRMWRTYFPRSHIYGIDIADKSPHDEPRIKTFCGSQVDEAFLEEVVKTIGRIDIIIDDGSHLNEHVIRSFQFLFPRMADDGYYVIEDTQTSYWNSFGGSSIDRERRDTSMGFFKDLIHCPNHVEFEIDDYDPTYYDKYINSMHFYHNLIFIRKKLNNELSNKHPGQLTPP
jgi:hypothetical protein